jgi:glutathione peroxidase-family protein
VTSGFEILAFPCNQFGGQEPGTNEEIVQFACTRFKAEYPIFDKVNLHTALISFVFVFSEPKGKKKILLDVHDQLQYFDL